VNTKHPETERHSQDPAEETAQTKWPLKEIELEAEWEEVIDLATD
jgi:hypothetical protein